jgi:large subunit ribosomal protein L32
MRHTRGHTGNRRSHHALDGVRAIKDATSGNLRLPHRVDEVTGMYRGKQIFSPKAKVVKGSKVKGPGTEPAAPHVHDHAHEHGNAETKTKRSVMGKLFKGEGKAKARSGFGGGA